MTRNLLIGVTFGWGEDATFSCLALVTVVE